MLSNHPVPNSLVMAATVIGRNLDRNTSHQLIKKAKIDLLGGKVFSSLGIREQIIKCLDDRRRLANAILALGQSVAKRSL